MRSDFCFLEIGMFIIISSRGEHMRKLFALIVIGLLVLSFSASTHAKPQGQLNLLYWQAPSTMNPNLSGGTKERDAASIGLEPLVSD